MQKYVVLCALGMALFVGASYAWAATDTTAPKTCVEEDRGYKLINADGTIDPVRLYGAAVKKIGESSLKGQTSPQLKQFGITTGDPREWGRLFVMLCKQESNCRIARTYPDGSLQKFPTTPQGERSYGPLQFNIGEYGLSSWAMVNSPSCTLEAFIRVAQQNKLLQYFGSMQRPNEVLQHANWFNKTVQPFADALTLIFDPNAPNNSATYRAVAPYFTDPSNSTSLGYQGPFGLSSQAYTPPGGIASMYPNQGAYPSQGAYAAQGATASQIGSPSSPFNVGLGNGSTQRSGGLVTGAGSRSASTIIVQPQNAKKGQAITISWTSVNMQPYSCKVRKNEDEFASGNEATKKDVAPAQSGTVKYSLTCTNSAGEDVQSNVSLTIQ